MAQPVSHPGTFWTQLKKRARKAGVELETRCLKFNYVAANGRSYKMDYADAQTLYYITQRMDAQTGLRDEILQFLAKSGVVLDEMRLDPEEAIDAAIEAYKRQGKSAKGVAEKKVGRR